MPIGAAAGSFTVERSITASGSNTTRSAAALHLQEVLAQRARAAAVLAAERCGDALADLASSAETSRSKRWSPPETRDSIYHHLCALDLFEQRAIDRLPAGK